MKILDLKILLRVLFTLMVFVAFQFFVPTVSAQNTFMCYCGSLSADNATCLTGWTAEDATCDSGYEANVSVCGGACSNDQFCSPNEPWVESVQCVATESVVSLNYGQTCTGAANEECPTIDGVATTCRAGGDNAKRCLKNSQSQSTQNLAGCMDVTECSGWNLPQANGDRAACLDGRCQFIQACNEDTAQSDPCAGCAQNRTCQAGIDGYECVAKEGSCGFSFEDEEDPDLADFNFCAQVPADQHGACTTCMGSGGGNENTEKLYTAVGCIQISNEGLVADIVKLLLGVAGGVALLTILAASFLMATSQGDPSRVKQARELITAAVAGLFFMIFSVILLQFVGVEILQIPGLG